ncbi:hypothetical protein EON66_11855, partial [archaeon]
EALAAGKFEMRPLPVLLSCVADMYNVVMNKDLLGEKNRDNLWKYIQRARASDKLQPLDPVNDMKIVDADFVELVSKCLAVQQKIDASPVQTAPDRDARFALYKQKVWRGHVRARRCGVHTGRVRMAETRAARTFTIVDALSRVSSRPHAGDAG